MKKKKIYESYNEQTKRIMNEISSEDTIFDDVQTGPQEESTLQEFKLDLSKLKSKSNIFVAKFQKQKICDKDYFFYYSFLVQLCLQKTTQPLYSKAIAEV